MSTSLLMRRLFSVYIRPYLTTLIGGLICMALSAASTALLAKMLQPVFDEIFIQKDSQSLYMVTGFMFILFLVKGFSTYGESLAMNKVGQYILSDLQKSLFSHLVKSDLALFMRIPSGEMTSHLLNDVNVLRSVVTNTITNIGKDSLTVIFLVLVMFYQDLVLSSVAFFVFPLALLPIVKIGKRMRKISSKTQETVGDLHGFLSQVFQGIRVVKAYGMEAYEAKRLKLVVDYLRDLTLKSTRIRSSSHPIMETLGGVAIVIVILYGGSQVIEGARTTGSFISFIAALLFAYEPLKRLSNLNANLQEGLAAAARLFSLMDEPSTLKDGSKKLVCTAPPFLKIMDVSFSYPESSVQALHDVSLWVPEGKKVALVGPSGSGKSTLFNLLLRFYDPQKGTIFFNEHPLSDLTFSSLRSSIAFVSQNVTLFDDTILGNICYGSPSASLEKAMEAAKLAYAHDFIMALPEGYQTSVGEHGMSLSGGQRQRIAIARALLRDAPLLLLDEATSSLDSESEHQIQEALSRLMKGRTVLAIAHRLTTIYDADLIYVFHKGTIVETGTHQALLDQGGLYARLYAGHAQETL